MNGAAGDVWQLTGANTYIGSVTVQGGTLRAGSAQAFGLPNALIVNGGTLDLNGFDMTFKSLAGTGGIVDTAGGELTISGTAPGDNRSYAGNITGAGGLTKGGTSIQTLTGANTYTGDTTVGGGTLALSFVGAGGPTNNIIAGASHLNMAGGTLAVSGVAGEGNTQTFTGLTVTAGSNKISATNATVNFGAINRDGGLVDFGIGTGATFTTTTNVGGTLGGWATVTTGTVTDYAKVDASGNIVAFVAADYTNLDNAQDWNTDGQFISDAGGAANTPFTGTTDNNVLLGGLKYTANAASTVTIGADLTLGVDGTILVSSSVLASTKTIQGGSLTGGINGGTLGILHNGTGNFTIASTIVNNGGDTGFTKAGDGLVTLTGPNTYTGVTTLSGGTLSVATIGNGGVASNIGASSAASSNLVLENGTLRYTGATATTDRGFTLVNGGPSRNIEVTNGATNLTFTGVVTSPDDAGLTKIGGGTLTLANGGNNYVGVTTVSAGILSVNTLANGGAVSGIGASGSGSANLALGTGGTLQYTGATVSSNRGFTLSGGAGGIDVNNLATTLTLSGAAIGTGTLTKSGAGTLVLSGINTYTGGTTVNAGILRAGSAQAFGSLTALMTVNTGATLDINSVAGVGVGALVGGGNVTLGSATLTVGGNSGTFEGTISGTGGLTRAGAGTQTMTGCNNSYTGVTNVAGGGLSVDCLANGGQASGIGASGAASANLTIGNAAFSYTGASVTTDRGFTATGGSGSSTSFIVTDGTATLEFTGVFAGSGLFVKGGPGTLMLSGNNTYSGTIQVAGGTVRAGSSTAFGTANVGLNNTAGVTLDVNNQNVSVASLQGGGTTGGNVTLGTGTLTITNGSGQNYAGAISGSGGLVKNGAGIQTLSGCNSSYTGTTTVNAGTLAVSCLNNGGVNSSIGASTADASNLVINGGTLSYVGLGSSTDRLFTLGASATSKLAASGAGAVHFTSTGAIAFLSPNTAQTIKLGGTSTADNSLAALITNNGSGVTSLTKEDTGTWILNNPNSSYTGITTINGGVLGVDKLANGGLNSSIGASSSLAANLVIGNGSTLRYTGTGDTTNRLFTLAAGTTFIESSGTGAIVFTDTGPVTLDGANLARTIALGGTNTGLNTLAGSIGNVGTGVTTLAKNDSGTWVLTGNNTFTGNTVINDGNLMIGNGGTTGNAGAGNVIVNSATSTLSFNRSDTFNFTGTLSGPGSIAQIGTGTTILTSAGNSIGGTRIDAGTLQVAAGGALTTATIAMNQPGASVPTLTVIGTVQGTSGGAASVITGDNGASNININAGGILRANGNLGGGTDIVTVSGTLDTGASQLNLGDGNDTLVLNDTAVFTGAGVDAGTGTGDILQVNNIAARTLDGANVTGFESLNKQLTGMLTLTGDHAYSAGTTIGAGELRIGAGGTSGSLTGDVLNNALLSFNRSDSLTYTGLISGTGGVNQIGTGITILTGNNSYIGPTNVNSGTLIINGIQSGTGLTSVASGAALGGSGTIGGNVTVAAGGAINPGGVGNSAGTLTINGNLALNNTSALNFNFGQANTPGGALNDLIEVEGDLVLDGILNVSTTIGGSFGPGVYRVINYSGALTNNGLDLGDMPDGSDVLVQTSVANQVNLVNQGGLLLTFWDGPGNQNDGTIQGGSGLWQNSTGNDNWTDAAGAVNAPWANGQFAIFMGSPGTVTVDNSLGAVSANGMQFAVDGYVINGNGTGPLTLVNDPSSSTAVIRVGDGTVAGAAMTATINVVLAGGATVAKTDLGTLILAGTNTYTGGTLIEDGILQVSSNANLGHVDGGLTINGGTLRNTGVAFASARTVTLGAEGGTFETLANLDLTGPIGGSGALTKTGTATLTLTAANDYSGGTFINGGTVSVSSDGNLGAATGALSFNGGTLQNTAAFTSGRTATLNVLGGTFQTDADLTMTGVIGGAGALTKTGGSALILTGTNSYAGGTTISSGTLQLGDGGSTGSITGNVLNNGTLVFNRDNTLTFAGLISGTGSVEQIGSGTTILTADNTYDGPTTVAEGSLIVNGDQTQADGDTTVEDGGTLGGNGTVGGNVFVQAGGTLAPGDVGSAPGTLTIDGNLSLSGGSNLAYNFGEANVEGGPFNDLTRVNGNLILDGEIDVTLAPGGAFGPGIYRVISYTGTLTDNTLVIDDIPSPGFSVQTSIANQVNLVNLPDPVLRTFWDLTPKDNDQVNGNGGIPTGTWQAAGDLDNWTDVTGATNGAWDNGNFAIFAGTAGTVIVDNGNGDVQAYGMQFATDGYLINGETLTLIDDPTVDGDPTSIIRVGDGTADGADYTATITAVLAGATELVKTDLGTLILTGTNTYTGGTRFEGGTVQVSSDANLGAADGDLTFDGGTLHTTASFATGRDVILESTGTIFTDPATTLTLNGPISGVGGWTKDGAGTVLQNGVAINGGPTTVAAGTLVAGGENVFSANSVYRIEADGTLDLAGNNQVVNALGNAGAVRLNGAPGTTLTTLGDYVGAGGTLFFNTVLGDDASVTDQLVVNGNTSGASNVSVTNVGGGGAQTVEGIKIIDIDGTSAGTFTLQGDYVFEGEQAVIGGAYAYTLQKNGVSTPQDGDWYLRSSLVDGPPGPLYQPGVPVYEAYAGILQSFNELDTLQQRVGNRSWMGDSEGQSVAGGKTDRSGIWARVQASHTEIDPKTSTTVDDYDVTTWKLQAGIDALLDESEAGSLMGGLSVFYGIASSNISSDFGDGDIDVTGYGIAGTLTWYSTGGVYVDAQGQATLYDSDLRSSLIGDLTENNDGFGYALSLEAGQKVVLDGKWSLTPQAQLAYSAIDYDDFTDPFGADVSLDNSDSLVGRLGLSLDYENEWQGESGEVNRAHLYGITNAYYDFLDGSEVDVSGTSFTLEDQPLWGSGGFGGSVNWAGDRYSLYAEALAKTSLEDFGDSYAVSGTAGFRLRW